MHFFEFFRCLFFNNILKIPRNISREPFFLHRKNIVFLISMNSVQIPYFLIICFFCFFLYRYFCLYKDSFCDFAITAHTKTRRPQGAPTVTSIFLFTQTSPYSSLAGTGFSRRMARCLSKPHL